MFWMQNFLFRSSQVSSDSLILENVMHPTKGNSFAAYPVHKNNLKDSQTRQDSVSEDIDQRT